MKKALILGLLFAISQLHADNFIFFSKPETGKMEMIQQEYKAYAPPKEEMITKKPVKMHKPAYKHAKKQTIDGGYWVQVGAFSKTKYAVMRRDEVGAIVPNVDIYQKDGYNRVVAGPFMTKKEAMGNLKSIKSQFPDAFLTTKNSFH